MNVHRNRVRKVPQRNRTREEAVRTVKASHNVPEGFRQSFWTAHPPDGYRSSVREADADENQSF